MVSESLKHILVVDDQDNWRRALKILLESEGLQVAEASNAQEAKIMLFTSHIDLVVLDVRLKDQEPLNVEGLELLESIKYHNPSMKTIVLTGFPDIVKNEPDADAFIFKVPSKSTFDIQGFKNQVRELLRV